MILPIGLYKRNGCGNKAAKIPTALRKPTEPESLQSFLAPNLLDDLRERIKVRVQFSPPACLSSEASAKGEGGVDRDSETGWWEKN